MEKYIPKFCHVHDLYRSGQVTRLISSSTADAVVPAFSFIDAVVSAFAFIDAVVPAFSFIDAVEPAFTFY